MKVLWELARIFPKFHKISGLDRVFISYENIMADPEGELVRLADALGIEVTERVHDEIEIFADSFVSKRLQHHKNSAGKLNHDKSVPKDLKVLYGELSALADGEGSTETLQYEVDRIEAALREKMRYPKGPWAPSPWERSRLMRGLIKEYKQNSLSTSL